MTYPATMQEAKEFVKTYQAQASKDGIISNVPVATLRKWGKYQVEKWPV